jgi:molecular chaperone GrpE
MNSYFIDNKKNFYKLHESVKNILEREFFKKKIVEQKNKFLRIFTDFENYKKRLQKEKFELIKLANQEVIIELIPVLDDFERCLLEINKDNTGNMIIGIKLIYEKFFSILKKKGLKQIKTKKGDNFSTDIHEALSQILVPSLELKNKIIDIVEMGYILYDKVIRHAKVIVGK